MLLILHCAAAGSEVSLQWFVSEFSITKIHGKGLSKDILKAVFCRFLSFCDKHKVVYYLMNATAYN